jgi:pimeloyl-ACP methyl ester carboxylesterase
MGDSRSYDFVIPYLDGNQFSYLFVDLRGYGRSKEMKGTYSLQEACGDVIGLADSMGWNQFHVMGHSMSGMIAQRLALDNGSRVKSIVAITSVPASGSFASKEMNDFLQRAALNDDAAAIECVNMLTGQRYTEAFAKNMVRDLRARSTSEARLGYLKMFSYTDFSESAKGLKTPILVLYGKYDVKESEALMRNTFLQWYPNSELKCCEASGHYPMIETPIAFVAHIEKFLSRA